MTTIEDGAEGRFWLIVREPGMVPRQKGPFRQPDTAKVLREFIAANPRAFIDHLTIDADGTPWVDHGPEVLQMTDGRSMSVGRKHNARVREAAEEALASAPVKPEWRCFHCGDVFTDERCARLHFGRDEDSDPACIIKAGAEQGLLGALREAEYAAADARQAIADESTDAAKAYHAQATRHGAALRNAEEAGYGRGLADGRSSAKVEG